MWDRSLNILLVEDNPGDARLLREMLRDAGHADVNLHHVSDLQQAFDSIATGSFDVVLLDLGLPGTRGLETFQRMHGEHPEVPVVVLSGLDDEEIAISAVQEGAQDYLVKKQISGGTLLRAIRYAVERHTALERELSQLRRGGESGAIAFVGVKGGVGVTTTVINFAAALAVKGKSTIAIEMNGRHGTFSTLLGRTPAENLSHLLTLGPGQVSAETVGPLLFRTPFGLRVLFGPQEARQEVDILPEQAAAIVDVTSRMSDIVVVDIPSFPTEAGREVMRRSWRVFMLLEPEPACMRSAQVELDALRTAGITGQLVGAIVVNRAAVPVGPNLDEIRDRLGLEIHAVIPPAAEACAAAQRSGTPVVLSQPDSVYATTISEAAERLTAQQILAPSVW